jgi:hypothetical protein
VYCLCVNVYCHRVTTQLQLINILYYTLKSSTALPTNELHYCLYAQSRMSLHLSPSIITESFGGGGICYNASEHHFTTDNSATVILHFLAPVIATKLSCSQQDFDSIRNFNSTSSEAHSILWTQITHMVQYKTRHTTHHKHSIFITSAKRSRKDNHIVIKNPYFRHSTHIALFQALHQQAVLGRYEKNDTSAR